MLPLYCACFANKKGALRKIFDIISLRSAAMMASINQINKQAHNHVHINNGI